MLKVKVNFSLPSAYGNNFVTLHDRQYTVSFDLQEGTHIAESELVELGVISGYHGKALQAQFSFQYTYDPKRDLVTVCGTDFDSADGMCLTTMPAGTTEYCRQRSAGGGFAADDLSANLHWNYVTSLTPGLKSLFQSLVRDVNDKLIAVLRDTPNLAVQVREPLPQLSDAEEQQFLTVYRNGAFLGAYDADAEYGLGDEVLTIQSVFGGTFTFAQNAAFANVIGSTRDPRIDGYTWIGLWQHYFGQAHICSSFQFNGFNCSNLLVGGHVVAGTAATVVDPGSNDVYIIPICNRHNSNNNVYMEPLQNRQAVWLNNYFRT